MTDSSDDLGTITYSAPSFNFLIFITATIPLSCVVQLQWNTERRHPPDTHGAQFRYPALFKLFWTLCSNFPPGHCSAPFSGTPNVPNSPVNVHPGSWPLTSVAFQSLGDFAPVILFHPPCLDQQPCSLTRRVHGGGGDNMYSGLLGRSSEAIWLRIREKLSMPSVSVSTLEFVGSAHISNWVCV